MLGIFVVILSCLSSAFAGVYFEKLLKNSTSTIWVRNIQLGLWGAMFGVLTAYVYDYGTIMADGFFQGYNSLVWTVIVIQAAGGLLVAVVVKYADNILKGFATSISIISSSILSMMFFAFQPGATWMAGALLVMCATVLYSMPSSPPPALLPVRNT
jgi:UDP-sugar transporter A1/2/3